MKVPSTIRLLLADSQELFRKGLVSLFSTRPGYEVVGEAENGLETVDMATQMNIKVVVLDILMPRLDGISVCRRIRKAHPSTEILFLTQVHNENRMRESFEAGGRGYLLKSCPTEELEYAIRKAAIGDYYLSGPVGQDMVNEYVRPLLEKQRPGGIMTTREREIARLLADGYSTKEAAGILSISPKTAETHRAAIMKKLNARNVTDIVKYCIRNHLIEP